MQTAAENTALPKNVKGVTQILTLAFPGVQALFGPNRQDFSQPPPQSTAGTLLPPYPEGEICLFVALQTSLLTVPASRSV